MKPIVVFDEIHQLRDPARLLKIGADMFPQLKILAIGSSTAYYRQNEHQFLLIGSPDLLVKDFPVSCLLTTSCKKSYQKDSRR